MADIDMQFQYNRDIFEELFIHISAITLMASPTSALLLFQVNMTPSK